MKEKDKRVKNKIQVQKFSVVFLPPVYPSKIFTVFRKLIKSQAAMYHVISLPSGLYLGKICSIFLEAYRIPTK